MQEKNVFCVQNFLNQGFYPYFRSHDGQPALDTILIHPCSNLREHQQWF